MIAMKFSARGTGDSNKDTVIYVGGGGKESGKQHLEQPKKLSLGPLSHQSLSLWMEKRIFLLLGVTSLLATQMLKGRETYFSSLLSFAQCQLACLWLSFGLILISASLRSTGLCLPSSESHHEYNYVGKIRHKIWQGKKQASKVMDIISSLCV